MADIELVVKIDEEMYKKLLSKGAIMCLSGYEGIIANGTPLPKGHRIGDLVALIRAMKERNDDNGGEPLNAVDRGYDLAYQHMVEEAKECVIIETDKGDKE